jgi:hypothetical protein
MVALITGLLGIGPGRTRLVGTVLALITTAAAALNSNGGIQVATPLLQWDRTRDDSCYTQTYGFVSGNATAGCLTDEAINSRTDSNRHEAACLFPISE